MFQADYDSEVAECWLQVSSTDIVVGEMIDAVLKSEGNSFGVSRASSTLGKLATIILKSAL